MAHAPEQPAPRSSARSVARSASPAVTPTAASAAVDARTVPAPSGTPARLVMVGAGPRAIGVLERLAAQADLLAGREIHVDLVDPFMPGAGRIWSAAESPLLLMNSRAADVTIFTDPSVAMTGPVREGPTLAAWAEGIREGRIPAPTTGTALRAEIDAIGADTFASRRIQGLYLEWFLGRVLAALPDSVAVRLHRERAVRTGAEGVTLAGGRVLPADAILLAAGHTDARPTPEREALGAFARRHDGVHIGPSQARDAHLAALAPGQDVIVRGMGLGFIDLMALLSEGRGGAFTPDPRPGAPGRLRYAPSGREPRLWVGSRRGVPYHSKVRAESVPAGPRDLVHLTDAALREREDAEGHLRFTEDVLPLIAAEIARAVPEAPDALADPAVSWLDDPLAGLLGVRDGELAARQALEAAGTAVIRHIEHDLRARTLGDASTERALFQMLLRIHGALVDLLPASRLHPGSRAQGPARWFSLFSFVDSGPPPHRLEQLLALERAGVVRFLGPRLRVAADEDRGLFVARGGAGTEIAASALVDAFLPEPTLRGSAAPLLRSLVAGGDALGREASGAPGRLEVDAEHRVLAPDGSVRAGLWAVGPWTSELTVGAFARPGTNAPVFRRNDALARALARHLATAPGAGQVEMAGSGPVADAAGADGAAADAGAAHPRLGAAAHPHIEGARRIGPTGSAHGPVPVLGIHGAGKLGTALARTALRSGLDVRLAGRADPAVLRSRIPGVEPAALPELARDADALVLAVPLHVALEIDPDLLAGAVVIDATNAWGEADAQALAAHAAAGRPAGGRAATGRARSSSEILAAHLHRSAVVKTLNHIGYHDLEEVPSAARAAAPGEGPAIALAADDPGARRTAADLLARLGFDPVDLGPLAEGAVLEPQGALFHGWRTRADLDQRRHDLARAA